MSPEEAQARLLHIVRRDPQEFEIERSRWRLKDLMATCPWIGLSFEASLHQVLERLGIVLKRGRDHVHSPDPDYVRKLHSIVERLEETRSSDGVLGPAARLLFLDELTYYRQPTAACAYDERGAVQPLAERSHRSNTPTRVIGTLDALDGRVVFWQGSSTSVDRIVAFYQLLCENYPPPDTLFIVQDNWPVHFHPDVLVALEKQTSPFPFKTPAHWPKEPSARARKKWGNLHLPIQILPLPTYASWANPIEKLWRWGRQTVLHLHRFAEDLDVLRTRFDRFLSQFASGSAELLRYVGLEHLDLLYRSAQDLPDWNRNEWDCYDWNRSDGDPSAQTLIAWSQSARAPT